MGEGKRYDGYIRVSQVRGRAGPNFISPDVQRQAIERWADANDVQIVAWHTDLDESGAKRSRPGFNRVMQRIRQGETEGVVVAKLDRFYRSLAGALEALKEIEEAEAAFVSVADNIDLSTPTGRAFLRILLVFAELEWERVRDNWAVAQEQAVARGIHVASKVPTGYTRREDGKLEPHPRHGPVVAEAFRMRAAGDSWRTIARFLNDRKVIGPYGSPHWRTRAVMHVLQNPVYLGEARSGKHVNRHAHQPLIDRTTWQAAQIARGAPSTRTDDPGILVGLVRCAGCRYLLKPDKMTLRDGTRARIYRCRGEHAAGICPDRASTLGHVIEPHVEARLFEIGETITAQGRIASLELAPLQEAVDEADLDLSAFRDDERISKALGVDRYVEGLEKRAQALAEAERNLAEAQQRLQPAGVPMAANLRDVWPDLGAVEKQKLLLATFDSIFLRSGRAPIEDRVVFFLRGEGPDDLPGRGRRVPFRPLDLPDDTGVAGS